MGVGKHLETLLSAWGQPTAFREVEGGGGLNTAIQIKFYSKMCWKSTIKIDSSSTGMASNFTFSFGTLAGHYGSPVRESEGVDL